MKKMMNYLRGWMLKSLLIICCITSSGIAAAQDTLSLEEITVTANKMEEELLDVPQSISVINDVELEIKEITTVDDVIKQIPNLSIEHNDGANVTFRGINPSSLTNNNPMVLYIDGIPQSSRFGYDASLANALRVEVLRGPQGTLYGKDSLGGVINIITKEPTNEVEGSITTKYGTDNYMQGLFNASGPIIEDKLFLGVNGIFAKDDGWSTNTHSGMDSDTNKEQDHKLNANLLYKPTNNLSIKLNVSNEKKDIYGFEGGMIASDADLDDYERDDFETVSFDQDTYYKTENSSQSLLITYDLDQIQLTSLTTHKKVELDAEYDFYWNEAYDGYNQYQLSTNETFNQEFRATGNNDKFRWVTGIYYEKDQFDFDKYGVQYPASGMEDDAVSQTDTQTLAVFGQMVIPFYEKYELTLGGRYQEIKKEMDLDYYYRPANTQSDPFFSFKEENTWNSFLPKIALSYKIDQNVNTYISLAKGYLAGGFNYFAYDGTKEDNMFDEQESINYEIGFKGDFLDHKLSLAAALFYMEIQDIQVLGYDADTGIMTTSNEGQAHSQGIELELDYKIDDNWKIDSAIGFIEAKYDDFDDNTDNKIPKTPSHTANVGLSYSNGNGFYGRFDIYNQGTIYFDKTNTYKEDPYTIGNVKVGYLFDHWDIFAYAKNITDESYLTYATSMGVYKGQRLCFGEGRFVAVGAKYSF